jgi:hypothetical protein
MQQTKRFTLLPDCVSTAHEQPAAMSQLELEI